MCEQVVRQRPQWHSPCSTTPRPNQAREAFMAKAVLTISSKNYGAWALRGWLMTKLAGLDFTEKVIPPDGPAMKAEMLLLSASMLVPSLLHGGITVWAPL